jgi:1,2-phenylacetyl-CoA epoxidase PaaB subunit
MGTVKELRDATPDEIAAWRKHIAIARHTKGYEAIWGKMHTVRDVVFDSYEPVNIGTMTSSLWK